MNQEQHNDPSRRRAKRAPAEYDFSKAVRGATAKRYAASSNAVMLDADVAAIFPDATAVNDALRLLARVAAAASPRRRVRGKAGSRKR